MPWRRWGTFATSSTAARLAVAAQARLAAEELARAALVARAAGAEAAPRAARARADALASELASALAATARGDVLLAGLQARRQGALWHAWHHMTAPLPHFGWRMHLALNEAEPHKYLSALGGLRHVIHATVCTSSEL